MFLKTWKIGYTATLAVVVALATIWATGAVSSKTTPTDPAGCPCKCGCLQSGVCDCGKKGVECPCKCGCAKSGVCDCGKKSEACCGKPDCGANGACECGKNAASGESCCKKGADSH
jgi:hypothetical protein